MQKMRADLHGDGLHFAFVIGAALAALSGVLYTVWGQYITPSSMGMTAAALPLIQSGKIRAVGFRWACDKQLRDAVTDFADDADVALARGGFQPGDLRFDFFEDTAHNR